MSDNRERIWVKKFGKLQTIINLLLIAAAKDGVDPKIELSKTCLFNGVHRQAIEISVVKGKIFQKDELECA